MSGNELIETSNAIIKSTRLSIEDHGMLSAWIYLDYGGSGQGFGGYALYLPKEFKHHAKDIPFAGHFIFRVLQIAGVTKWADLPDKTIRVRREHSKVHAIGHIIEDDWFDPTTDFAEMK